MIVEEKNGQPNAVNFLFQDFNETVRKLSPTQLWNAEINLYQNLPRADGSTDPLVWWKAHVCQLPFLGISSFFYSSFLLIFIYFLISFSY
jgi:hypothetical protein